MADYSTTLDSVPQSTGKIAGFITWHALASQDGIHAPGSFSVRNRDGRRSLDLSSPGFVADWPHSRTGWEHADPDAPRTGAPERIWNPSRNKIARRPGDNWKRVIELPIAIGEQRFIWNQASYGAWEALVAILKAVGEAKGEQRIPQLPLFTHLGAISALSGSSLIPTFALLRFVEPPDCLRDVATSDEAMPAIYRGNGAQPGSDLNDEIPF
jgi:hypothetical protein